MSGQAKSQPKSIGPTAAIWLLLAVAVTAGIYWAVTQGKLTWADAADTVAWARQLVADNLAIALVAYFALFVGASLLLFPAQLWIILLGGILFGFPLGAATSWTAAMTSSILVFLLARSTIGAFYRRRAGRFLQKVDAAFQKDQLFYMLTMRFVPVLPYCVANVVPAVLGARLRGYAVTTAIGVLPYVSVYSFVGSRAGSILDPEFQLEVGRVAGELLPVMFAFALLPLLALGMKRLVNRRKASPPSEPTVTD